MLVTFAHGKALIPRCPCATGIVDAVSTRGFSTVTVAFAGGGGAGLRMTVTPTAMATITAASTANIHPIRPRGGVATPDKDGSSGVREIATFAKFCAGA